MITQSELARLAGIKQKLETLEAEEAGIRSQIIALGAAAVAAGKVDGKGHPVLDVEPGPLRVVVNIGDKKANVDWNAVKATIKAKNCTFVNGGGKVKELNSILETLVEDCRPDERPRNDSVSVKPNVVIDD